MNAINSFSKTSLDRLNTCHNDLKVVMFEVLKIIDITIATGHRTRDEQQRAYHNGKSKLQYPHSKHNKIPSMAVDVYPYYNGRMMNGEQPYDKETLFYLAGIIYGIGDRLYRAGKITHKLRLGADFNQNNIIGDEWIDQPHVELIED